MPREPTERTALLRASASDHNIYPHAAMEGPPIVVSELRESPESIQREAEQIVNACLRAARIPSRQGETPNVEAKLYIGLGNLVNANNVNALVDAIITQFLNREEIQKLINPLRIDKEIPIDDSGNHVSNIVVDGLMTFGRTADAVLSVLEDGSISVEAALGVKQARIDLNYAYNAGCCLNLKGAVGAHLEGISVFLRINIVGFQPSLSDLDFEFGDPEVQSFSGASCAFNWLTKFIANRVIVGRKEEIRQQVITQGKEQLGDLLSKVDILGLISGKIPIG